MANKKVTDVVTPSTGDGGAMVSVEDILKVLSGVSPSGLASGDSLILLLDALPTAATGLSANTLYTQTATQIGGSGTTKVLCVAS